MPRPRATMAQCEEREPTSVTMPTTRSRSSSATSLGRQVVRDQHGRAARGSASARWPSPSRWRSTRRSHVEHVGLALAQVLGLDARQVRGHARHVGAEHPGGVAALLADALLDRAQQVGVVEDHQVGAVDLGLGLAQLARRCGRGCWRGRRARPRAPSWKRPTSCSTDRRGDRACRAPPAPRARSGRSGPRPRPGDAAMPVNFMALPRTCRPPVRAAPPAASLSSGPSARTRMVLPSSAASIMTPMMLLPFTSRSSRRTKTSDGEPGRGLHEQRAGPGVQPELVADQQFGLGHTRLPWRIHPAAVIPAYRNHVAATHSAPTPSAHSVGEGRGRAAATSPSPSPAANTAWNTSGRGLAAGHQQPGRRHAHEHRAEQGDACRSGARSAGAAPAPAPRSPPGSPSPRRGSAPRGGTGCSTPRARPRPSHEPPSATSTPRQAANGRSVNQKSRSPSAASEEPSTLLMRAMAAASGPRAGRALLLEARPRRPARARRASAGC